MCELHKIVFLRDMMVNQYANIFSTHETVYGSHSVMFAFIERENFFFHVYSQLNFLKLGLCVFIYPHLLNFPQNILYFLLTFVAYVFCLLHVGVANT